MGANLCSLRHSSSSIADDHDDHDNHDHQEPKEPINQTIKSNNTTTTTSCLSIVDLIRRSGCLQITDHKDKKRTTPLLLVDTRTEEKISEKKKLTTLEDWIMDSPGMNNNSINNDASGELHVFKQPSSRKVHPSSSSSSKLLSSTSSTRSSLLASRVIDSIILEPVVKSYGTSCSNNLASKNKSVRFTKKVRFKEEPNIIIYYSPD